MSLKCGEMGELAGMSGVVDAGAPTVEIPTPRLSQIHSTLFRRRRHRLEEIMQLRLAIADRTSTPASVEWLELLDYEIARRWAEGVRPVDAPWLTGAECNLIPSPALRRASDEDTSIPRLVDCETTADLHACIEHGGEYAIESNRGDLSSHERAAERLAQLRIEEVVVARVGDDDAERVSDWWRGLGAPARILKMEGRDLRSFLKAEGT